MTSDLNSILSSQYPESVEEAVRYGYLYRKKSEVNDSNLHHCLHDASAILLWIASAVASGVVYDVIKETAKRFLYHIRENKQELDKDTEAILEDDGALKEFTIYIEEYYAHDMKISVEQEKYIKEEVIADTAGQEASKIFEETGRFVLKKEEYVSIGKIARGRAEEIIHRHK